VDQIEHLDGNRFLELVNSGAVRSLFQPEGSTTMEGLLYPETYRIEDTEDEEAVLRRMVSTFDQVASEVGVGDAEARVGVSPYEAIIVASLIEAEAKDDGDRPKIARVIYNRLEQGIPLGIDATFYYHLGLERKGTGLRTSDLEDDHEFNTRLRQGLIPHPIAMPRRAAVCAADSSCSSATHCSQARKSTSWRCAWANSDTSAEAGFRKGCGHSRQSGRDGFPHAKCSRNARNRQLRSSTSPRSRRNASNCCQRVLSCALRQASKRLRSTGSFNALTWG